MKKSIHPQLLVVATFSLVILAGFLSSKTRNEADLPTKIPRRTVRFSYSLALKQIPARAKNITIFLPVPRSSAHQNIANLKLKSDYSGSFYSDPEYGNSIYKLEINPQQLFNSEKSSKGIPADISLTLEFEVTRSAYHTLKKSPIHNKPTTTIASPEYKDKNLLRFLSPDRLIPIDGAIAEIARQVVNDQMSDLDKARAIYYYVASNLRYDKTGTGWGKGDAIYACQTKSGNCTDFHSLFIGMARACKIPARFIIGFPLPEGQTAGEITSYHCWAEFYIDSLGWIPVDASEASKHPEKREFLFGGLDENRVAFTCGRDIQLDPHNKIAPLNYFIYPFVLVDNKPYSNLRLSIRFSNADET